MVCVVVGLAKHFGLVGSGAAAGSAVPPTAGPGVCREETLAKWARAVAGLYPRENPYHNALHAADVAATASALLAHSGALALKPAASAASAAGSSTGAGGELGSVVYNVKDLAQRCGALAGERHPAAVPLAELKHRVGPLSDQLAARVGVWSDWLARYHSTFFEALVNK